jgi:hypothetical protein
MKTVSRTNDLKIIRTATIEAFSITVAQASRSTDRLWCHLQRPQVLETRDSQKGKLKHHRCALFLLVIYARYLVCHCRLFRSIHFAIYELSARPDLIDEGHDVIAFCSLLK